MEIIDLHTHSLFSDGAANPEEYTARLYSDKDELKKEGLDLRAIALTDHDTMNGIEPMERALAEHEEKNNISDKVKLLHGIELSTQTEGIEIHLLGYFPHTPLEIIDKRIGKHIQDNMNVRNNAYKLEQGPLLIELFAKRHKELTGEKIEYDLQDFFNRLDAAYENFAKEEFKSKSPSDKIQWVFPFPRGLIRKVIEQAGIAPEKVTAKYSDRKDPKGDLKKYYKEINRLLPPEKAEALAGEDIGRYTYLPSITPNYMTTERAVELISSANGKAFFAHPYEYINKKGKQTFETLVKNVLTPAGLTGIECHYPHHTKELTAYLSEFAKNNSLMISGGTDNHIKRDYEIFGKGHSEVNTPFELYKKIIE